MLEMYMHSSVHLLYICIKSYDFGILNSLQMFVYEHEVVFHFHVNEIFCFFVTYASTL